MKDWLTRLLSQNTKETHGKMVKANTKIITEMRQRGYKPTRITRFNKWTANAVLAKETIKHPHTHFTMRLVNTTKKYPKDEAFMLFRKKVR